MLEQLTGREDPYPIYEQIRARGPLARDNGVWVTGDYATCNKILRDRRFGVRYTDGTYPGMSGLLPESFLETDPPDHTRLRRLAAPAFSPRKIDEYRTRVEKVAESLLDADQFDLIAGFAAPLPIAVISELLGIPDSDTGDFADYGRLIAASFDQPMTPEMRLAAEKVGALFERLIADRRARPGDDVISSLVAAEAEQKLTVPELMGTLVLLLIAGFETTVNLIGNGVRALLDHPAQWALFKANPEMAPDVVEEVLRWAPPVHLTNRIAHEQVDLVAADQEITLLLGAANRDPDVFPDAHRFDVMRVQQPEHLAFSSGVHYCLGATLARMEGAVAFRTLARRMPDLRQAGPATFRESIVIRGLASLPVSRS
ncbi:cytochrome P450 [Lentzea nigeriaca]|uniref:cytochrome P450 n=1 Tax=Lentzea nigeriaca TaxID=1128665 RepID=UPI00195EDA6A|nr:cytochrome P450 [Lentzea nigeriaca]MBM7860103.1 cytochrome P450 [Lentzea nigeriaca]